MPQIRDNNEKGVDEPPSSAKKHTGEGDIQLDKDKLELAIKAEREKKRKGSAHDDDIPLGKRKKHSESLSSRSQEVTEEELGMSLSTIPFILSNNFL